ncbi:MAG: DNA/RNA non-specific endonuclease, partial [Gammaproteobacteria bacterium]
TGFQTSIFQPDLANAQDRDYRLSEVLIESGDSGRLAPMSSFAGTPYWSDLNYLSNMSPLPADLRIGSWARLDQAINELAAERGELWVLTGPLYEIRSSLAVTSAEASNRPAGFFKVIAMGNEAAAFVFPAALAQHAHYCAQYRSVAEVQARYGLDLFPASAPTDGAELRAALRCQD